MVFLYFAPWILTETSGFRLVNLRDTCLYFFLAGTSQDLKIPNLYQPMLIPNYKILPHLINHICLIFPLKIRFKFIKKNYDQKERHSTWTFSEINSS